MIKTQVEVTQEFLNDLVIKEEEIYRDLAIRLIKQMPIENLSKVFGFVKIDPNDPKCANNITDKEFYTNLKNKGLILFEVRLDI